MIPAGFAPLASHLWQSTLFACAAGLLTLALLRNQARVRYAVWLAASYKFLIPFSWLVSLGNLFGWRSMPTPVSQSVAVVTNMVDAPQVLLSSPVVPQATPHFAGWPELIWAAWACGFAIVTFGWIREWYRIRATVKSGQQLDLGLPIRAVTVNSQFEPGVFGIFRPVLLLPGGIERRLTPEQLRTVIAHELCHVRRRDNLAAAIQMLVEGLFWFHPLVWWLDRRIVVEREHACDEEVLQIGGEPVAYAETILTVCKSYIETPSLCMSGISGADLKKRVVRIMSLGLTEKLTLGRKVMLLVVGFAAVAGPLVFGMANTPLLGAQDSGAGWEKAAGGKMKFDVASIKEDKAPPGSGAAHSNVAMTTWDFPVGARTGGLFSVSDFPFDMYLGYAYKLQGYANDAFERQLPQWASFGGKRYDIEARAAGNPTQDQYRLMMQSLLRDRFKLAVHWETKQVPAMALALDKSTKLGPHLRAHSDVPPCPDSHELFLPQIVPATTDGFPLDCGVIAHDRKNVAPGNTRYFARKVSMASLAVTLSTALRDSGKPVIDKTGLTGNYDFIFEYTPDNLSQSTTNAISLTSALKDDLGLKLELVTAPVDVLILDHIEEPTPN